MEPNYVYKKMTPEAFARWVKKRGVSPDEEICYGCDTARWFDENNVVTDDSQDIENWCFIKRIFLSDKHSDSLLFDTCGGGDTRAMVYFDNDYFIEDFIERINHFVEYHHVWVEMTEEEYQQTLKEV